MWKEAKRILKTNNISEHIQIIEWVLWVKLAHTLVFAGLNSREWMTRELCYFVGTFNFRSVFYDYYRKSLTCVEKYFLHAWVGSVAVHEKQGVNYPKINYLCVSVSRFLWNSPQQKTLTVIPPISLLGFCLCKHRNTKCVSFAQFCPKHLEPCGLFPSD